MEGSTRVLCAVFLLILCQPQNISGTARIYINLLYYENSLGYGSPLDCCDGSTKSNGICDDQCDTEFTICLGKAMDNFDPTTINLTNTDCSYGMKRVAGAVSNSINFTALPNNPPVVFDLSTFEPRMLVKIGAYDADTNLLVLIDSYIFAFEQTTPYMTSASLPYQYFTINGTLSQFFPKTTSISLQMSGVCDINWYNSSCDVNCVPTDECKGRYRCDAATGAKVCNSGWASPDKDCTVKDENVSLPTCGNVSMCKNGAECFIGANNQSYCCCQPGYRSVDCSVFSNCTTYSCRNGATCYQMNATRAVCICSSGYTGSLCQTPMPCAFNNCKNNAICTPNSSLLSYSCNCIQGPRGESFTGTYCEITIDACVNHTCKNNATCVPDVSTNTYTCNCPQRYTGTQCDIPVDPCVNHTCKNNATCVPDVPTNNYTCNCSDGNTAQRYTGSLCEIDPCVNHTCENNAACVPDLQSDQFNLTFNCTCLHGYTGLNCEIDIDECTNNPCASNQTCIQLEPTTPSDALFICSPLPSIPAMVSVGSLPWIWIYIAIAVGALVALIGIAVLIGNMVRIRYHSRKLIITRRGKAADVDTKPSTNEPNPSNLYATSTMASEAGPSSVPDLELLQPSQNADNVSEEWKLE